MRDDDNLRHNLLVPYADLPENEKESNRATVRMIPEKLAHANRAIAPAGSAPEHPLDPNEVKALAIIEHDLWVDRKKAAGYELGPKPTESPKRSPYLVDWNDLKPEWQEVDTGMIDAIPAILAEIDYIIVDRT